MNFHRNGPKIAARTRCVLSLLTPVICLLGCTSHTVHLPAVTVPSRAVNSDYIDIQAGWRLTVVTPILKSGGYVLKSFVQQKIGDTLTLSAGEDLLGYETAHYLVKGRPGRRVRVEFNSAEVTKDGKTEPQPRSIAPLFQAARKPGYLRLIYLIRVSEADHNMAVVTASRLNALETLTREVVANPNGACKPGKEASCSWIPEGIAARPEVLKTVNGTEMWVDAPR